MRVVHGEEIAAYIAQIASLRISVFREFPYLYDGDIANEKRYLATYTCTPHSTVVLALENDAVVGVATAMPLLSHGDDVIAPVVSAGYDPAQVFYFAESVLLPAFRRQRIGHAFFDHREATARQFGYQYAAFCAVDRPADHRRRPTTYVSHERFWQSRGFVRKSDMIATMTWRDIDEDTASPKRLTFWWKDLI
jgi:GNAT superfamily N-acetyltransferase